MPTICRGDEEGASFHLTNRAIARRTLVECREDVRFFLAQLARVVRAGMLEVHAYCIMTTHFHLLVRSLQGRLSVAMRELQLPYSRWFNRRRLRDGPLFRGRFRSSLVRTMTYRAAVLAYIDRNPVEARIVKSPSAYPYGSTAHLVKARGPIWLERSVAEGILADRGGAIGAGPDLYDAAILGLTSGTTGDVIERRLRDELVRDDDAPIAADPLDDLVRAAPERVQEWMVERAASADATRPGVVILSPASVIRRTADILRRDTEDIPRLRRGDVEQRLAAGLLRSVCGLTYQQVRARLDCALGTAHRRSVDHLASILRDPCYASVAARIVAAALEDDYPRAGMPARAIIEPFTATMLTEC